MGAAQQAVPPYLQQGQVHQDPPGACVSVSLFRRLPGWVQRIHPVALTAARTTLVQGFPYTAIKVQVDAEYPARIPEKPLP